MTLARVAVALTALGWLTACAYPVSTADQGAASAGIYFPNAPLTARVFVDGADAGEAATFDGKKTLLVMAPGRHHLVVRQASTPIYDKPIYVGSGAHIAIKVN